MRVSYKQLLNAGGRLVGTYIQYPAPNLIEILKLAGLNYVVLDMEHGQNGYSEIMNMLYACDACGMASMVRLHARDQAMVQKLLDMGVSGIKFADIATAEEAAEAVRICKYPPQGVRGGCPGVRANAYGTSDFKTNWARMNDDVAVSVLIESVEGIRNMEEIIATPGIDCINVGLGDLHRANGLARNDPLIKNAIQTCVDLCKKYRKFCPVTIQKPDDVKKYEGNPYAVFALKRPESVLNKAYRDLLAEL